MDSSYGSENSAVQHDCIRSTRPCSVQCDLRLSAKRIKVQFHRFALALELQTNAVRGSSSTSLVEHRYRTSRPFTHRTVRGLPLDSTEHHSFTSGSCGVLRLYLVSAVPLPPDTRSVVAVSSTSAFCKLRHSPERILIRDDASSVVDLSTSGETPSPVEFQRGVGWFGGDHAYCADDQFKVCIASFRSQ